MSNQYNIGDLVKLKSGGPDMTVQTVNDKSDGTHSYWCQWFAGRKLERGIFSEDSLQAV